MNKLAVTLWLVANILWPVQHLGADQEQLCTAESCCTQLSDSCDGMGSSCPTGSTKLLTVESKLPCTQGHARIAAIFAANASVCESINSMIVSFGCKRNMAHSDLHVCVNSEQITSLVSQSFFSWITNTNCDTNCGINKIKGSSQQPMSNYNEDTQRFQNIMCVPNYEQLLLNQVQLLVTTLSGERMQEETVNTTQDNSVILCLRIENCTDNVFYSHTGFDGDCKLPHSSVCDPLNENNTDVLCESYDTMTPSFIEANETQTDDMICPYYKNIIYNVMENGSSCPDLQELHDMHCDVVNTTCYCSSNLERCEEISSGSAMSMYEGSSSSSSGSSSTSSLSSGESSTPFTEERNDSFCICFKPCELPGCIDGNVRLVGKNDRAAYRQGRVEVCFNNTWGTVCGNGWSPVEAQVVCRQLGYSLIQEKPIVHYNAPFGGAVDPTRPIFLEDVSCAGNESELVDCIFKSQHDCNHSMDVGVECYVVELSIVELSIEGPTTVTEPENGNHSLKFTVLLSTEPNLTLGSDLMLSLHAERGGDATPDEDYYLLPTSQSFIVGDTNGATITFNVNIASDDFVELDESIILRVVHPHFRGVLFPNRRFEIRVSDSDVANISIAGPDTVPTTSNTATFVLSVSLATEPGIRLGSTLEIGIVADCRPSKLFVTFQPETNDGNAASRNIEITVPCFDDQMQQDRYVVIQLFNSKISTNIRFVNTQVTTTIKYLTGEQVPTTTETQDETTTVTGAMTTVEMTTAESETITNTGELTSTVSGTQDEMTAAESDAPNLHTMEVVVTTSSLLRHMAERLTNVQASSFLLEYDRMALMYGEGFHDITPGISLQVLNTNSTEPGVVANTVQNNSITLPFQIINASEPERFTSFIFNFGNLSQIFPATLDGYDDTTVESAIITAALVCNESYCDTRSYQLPEDSLVVINLEHKELQNQEQICVFWEFIQPPNSSISGEWNTSGCTLNRENSSSTMAVCECNHLTHFAVLLSPIQIPPDHAVALQAIGYVGISISLLALAVTALVFICFKSLWSMRNYIHINLCLSLMASHLVFVVGVDKTSNEDVCAFIGVLLHYLFLVSFMWMLMEGVVLYVVLVKVFVSESSKKLYVFIFTIVSYGLPLLYVLVVSVPIGFLLNGMKHYYYIQEDTSVSACWLRYDTHFIWSFNVPIIIIILINLGLFIMALVILQRQRKKSVTNQSIRHSITQWIKSAVTLTVIMGLTWIIGVLIFHRSLVSLAYIFTIAIAFQGLAIFIVLVLMSKQVRLVFMRWLRDRVNESSFLSSHFGDKLDTLMSRSRKDTNSSQKHQSNVNMGYKLGTFGTTVATSDSFQNQTFTDARSSWKNNHSLKNGSFESSTATDFDNPVYAKKEDEQKGSKPASLNEWASDAEDVVVSSVTVHLS